MAEPHYVVFPFAPHVARIWESRDAALRAHVGFELNLVSLWGIGQCGFATAGGAYVPTKTGWVCFTINTTLFALSYVVVLFKTFTTTKVLVCLDGGERGAAHLALLLYLHTSYVSYLDFLLPKVV